MLQPSKKKYQELAIYGRAEILLYLRSIAYEFIFILFIKIMQEYTAVDCSLLELALNKNSAKILQHMAKSVGDWTPTFSRPTK